MRNSLIETTLMYVCMYVYKRNGIVVSTNDVCNNIAISTCLIKFVVALSLSVVAFINTTNMKKKKMK